MIQSVNLVPLKDLQVWTVPAVDLEEMLPGVDRATWRDADHRPLEARTLGVAIGDADSGVLIYGRDDDLLAELRQIFDRIEAAHRGDLPLEEQVKALRAENRKLRKELRKKTRAVIAVHDAGRRDVARALRVVRAAVDDVAVELGVRDA